MMGFTTTCHPCFLLAWTQNILTVGSQELYHSTGWARGVGGSWVERILESSHSLAWYCHCNRNETYRDWAHRHSMPAPSPNNPNIPNFDLKQYLKSRRTRLGHRLIKVQRSRENKHAMVTVRVKYGRRKGCLLWLRFFNNTLEAGSKAARAVLHVEKFQAGKIQVSTWNPLQTLEELCEIPG